VCALQAQRCDVVARVARAVHDEDAAVRRTALAVIASSRSALARRVLLQMVEEQPDVDVVRAAGALRDVAVVPPIVRHLGAPDAALRAAAVAALATDPDEGVRAEVARLLVEAATPAARAALERLVLDPSASVASIAQGALPIAA
jgi:HEAT repeat protein